MSPKVNISPQELEARGEILSARLQINVRNLPSPLLWGSARAGMSWHHIIPFALLRGVWNRLVRQHIATQMPEALVAIRQYLLLSDSNLPEMDKLIERLRADNTDQRRSSHYELRPLDIAEFNRLVTAATWHAWNVVEGPTRRSDDPADAYIDRFTAGLTPEETTRMKAIEVLFNQFSAFVNAGLAPGPGNLRAMAQTVTAARLLVRCDRPIRYRPEMWVENDSGVWSKRRDGNVM